MTKDYCSFAPETFMGFDLSPACAQHDADYEKTDKYDWAEIRRIDLKFKAEIARRSNNFISWVYFIGVRSFARYNQFKHFLGWY